MLFKMEEQVITFTMSNRENQLKNSVNISEEESSFDFFKTLQTKQFVDKTLLIPQVLSGFNHIFITAPTRFGKSLNLNMLKYFFEIQVTEEGDPQEDIQNTTNYKLFMNNGLRIANETSIIVQHFARYPVIWVDFQSNQVIQSFDEFWQFCRYRIHLEFKRHWYLKISSKLDDAGKQLYEKWSDPVLFKNLDRLDTVYGLHDLSSLLYLHFDRKCFLLVDGYEIIISRGNFTIKSDLAKGILNFYMSILLAVVKNEEYMERTVITGTSRLGIYYEVCNFGYFSIRDDNFFKFYGLKEEEVYDLFIRFNISEKLRNDTLKYYDGYMHEFTGIEILRTSSIMLVLEHREVRNYWPQYGIRFELGGALMYHNIKMILNRLFAFEKAITIKYQYFNSLTVDAITKKKNVFFSYLVDQGYCIVHRETILDSTLKISNLEAIEELRKHL